MSAIYIVATIIGVIGAVICYLFITQSIEKKRKQRQRLVAALKQRAKVFRYILSGFPPNFLTRELTMLVQRCLTDVLQQLASLEPKEKTHVEELSMISQQLQATQQRKDESKRPTLQSPQQVKDVKQHLQELYKFLMTLQKRGTIKRAEAEDFGDQIKHLVLKISVDSYVVQAKQAKQAGKNKLALHYFSLAKKLIERDESGHYTAQKKKLEQIITQLESEEDIQPAATANSEQEGDDWGDVETKDSWKKKNVYDE